MHPSHSLRRGIDSPLLSFAFPVVVAFISLLVAAGNAQSQHRSSVAVADDGIASVVDLRRAAADLNGRIDALRTATARFRDVEVALAEGYVRDPLNLCVSASTEGYPRQLGAMGIHYFRPDLLGLTATAPRVAGTGTHIDFETPAVLVYFPDDNGQLQLGAIENVVFARAWGRPELPSFHGNQYWSMVDNPATSDLDEAHGFEPHYELHLWVHKDNPLGVGYPFNPEVSCATYDGPRTMEEGIRWATEHAPPAN